MVGASAVSPSSPLLTSFVLYDVFSPMTSLIGGLGEVLAAQDDLYCV